MTFSIERELFIELKAASLFIFVNYSTGKKSWDQLIGTTNGSEPAEHK